MKLRTAALTLASAVTLLACNNDSAVGPAPAEVRPAELAQAQQALPQQQTLDDLYSEGTRVLFQGRPVSATQYGLPEEEVGRYYANILDDHSPAAEQALRDGLRDLSGKIAAWPMDDADEEARINRDILANVTRYFAGHKDYPIGYIDTWMGLSPFIVNQINGPLMDIPRQMQESQLINNERDAEDYVSRLASYDDMVAGVQRKLEADAESGWIAPAAILQGALDYIDRFIAAEAEQHTLVTSFAKRLDKVAGISPQARQDLIERAQREVSTVVYPAYRAIAGATRSLLEKAPKESGVWTQPGGEAYYRDAIRFLGDSDMSADEIHAVGLAEIERIGAEMDTILRAQGHRSGSVGERMVALSEDDRFLYEDSVQGRQALLADLNTQIVEITALMAPWFQTKPPYPVEVRAYAEEIQDGMPGGEYQSPSVDGSKPGIYWINLRDMKGVPSFTLKTLTYHEANPGHHWQVALNLAQEDFPFLRRISPYNAYAEGWALYAEQVAMELGVYRDDPYGDLGRLQDEMFRAVRLVVDTGLHHKRWSQEEAIAFMSQATGKAESEVVAEIERYMTWPGQALGYKLGMIKIQELRQKAKRELGDKFDLAAFHDLLLLGGAMPMSVLEVRVDRWIEAQSAG